SGVLVRTGAGPGNCRTWNTYKWGTGPFLDGLFSQSNLGIVTKAGVWLMPQPEAFTGFVCQITDDHAFHAAVDALRCLGLQRVVSNVHIVNDFLLLTTLISYPYDLRRG